MEFIIGITAFLASLLTLFSGFGLGTILMPVFGLFFPVPIAVALTGIVHLLNNLFKLSLLGRHAVRSVVLRFGLPSILGGFAGAWVLIGLANLPAWSVWHWKGVTGTITPIKLVIAALMLVFALMEALPALKRLAFPAHWLVPGGLLSGFFGGLSGHQGALRSAFLVHAGLDKQQFIATGVVVACLVDMTRIPVYASRFATADLLAEWPVVLIATVSAFLGAWIGTRYLHKVTFDFVRALTGAMIGLIAILLAVGIL